MAQQTSPVDYANLPAGSPPPGVLPNFEHPDSRATEVYVAIGICMSITLIFIILRLYVKLCVTHLWGWDDVVCVTGWISQLCFGIVSFTLMGPDGALGYHIWDVRRSSLTKGYLQRTLATLTLYAASAFLIKLSVFQLYLRLFKIDKTTRWLIYAGIVVCGLFYSASIISNCALSMPKPGQSNDTASWLQRAVESKITSRYLAVVQSVFAVISDIYLLVIPVKSIFQLKLPTKRKFGVSAIFMVGIIAIVCSLGSLGYRVRSITETDSTWFNVSVWIFSYAEISAGIICSCMPILAALARPDMPHKLQLPSVRYFPSLGLWSRNTRSPPPLSALDESISADGIHSGEVLSNDNRNYMELQSGAQFVEANNAIMVTRKIEVV